MALTRTGPSASLSTEPTSSVQQMPPMRYALHIDAARVLDPGSGSCPERRRFDSGRSYQLELAAEDA